MRAIFSNNLIHLVQQDKSIGVLGLNDVSVVLEVLKCLSVKSIEILGTKEVLDVENIELVEEKIEHIKHSKVRKATLTQLGNHYTIQFRHPLLKDKLGKSGRKVQRGLGNDKELAERVHREINVLLSNPSLWDIDITNSNFDSKTLDIFYYKLGELKVD